MSLPCESDSYPSTETATCNRCAKVKPLSSFNHPPGSNGVKYRHRTCRACYKTTHRRKNGARPRTEIVARPKAAPTHEQMLRRLRTLLGKLFEQRCETDGVNPSSVDYRVRYQADPEFRAKEVARRWARKEVERQIPSDGTLTPQVVRSLFAAATHCPYCTEPVHPRDKTLDHIIPVSRGGLHSSTNVIVACRSCNSIKHARTPGEWMGSAGIAVASGALRHNAQVVVAA
jgi:5-methylcytosine-specific restriction endonuclease McrA